MIDQTETRKYTASGWFRSLRDQICSAFEEIENDLHGMPYVALPPGRFKRREWKHVDGGGGEVSMMHGRVFEKVGVNISTVYGNFAGDFRKQLPGTDESGAFWATGISLVAHMRSPLVPAVHMNLRHLVTTKGWFGGGADLTPAFFNTAQTAEDKKQFHAALRAACDKHDPAYYAKFSRWCDSYFYLKHRDEPRGVGGIFFDNLENDWDKDFAFVQDVGKAFLDIYPRLVRAHMEKPWTREQREHLLIRRGRYVEFNLLYDRGTTFGLKTGGDTEAILMSMPPEVRWP